MPLARRCANIHRYPTMPMHQPADIPERFSLDSSEALLYAKVEQRIERNLASDRPALTREEVDQKARAVIASALIRETVDKHQARLEIPPEGRDDLNPPH